MEAKILSYIQQISLGVVPVLFSITVHEVSHGYVAYLLGDDTAKRMGRLTLNPLKHLDPIGLLVFLVTRVIGWAKPVPVNPLNLRNPKRDMMWVAAAGPASNMALAFLFAAAFRGLVKLDAALLKYFVFFFRYGILPPLEGAYRIVVPLVVMCAMGAIINVALCFFNLIPILPLDGGRILYGILPERLASEYAKIEPWGLFIVILLVLVGGIDKYLGEIIWRAAGFLLGF